jgi:hypothetical protein
MFSRLRFCLPMLLLPLFGCGPGRNDFAPVCPTARLIPALADLTRYAGPGPAHDLTDLILQARVTAVNGKCTAGDDKSILPATVDVTISVQRGPAMQGREADVPVFLAVTEGDAIRDKKVFRHRPQPAGFVRKIGKCLRRHRRIPALARRTEREPTIRRGLIEVHLPPSALSAGVKSPI